MHATIRRGPPLPLKSIAKDNRYLLEMGRLLHGGHGPSFAFQGFTTEVYGEVESMGPIGGKMEVDLPEEQQKSLLMTHICT